MLLDTTYIRDNVDYSFGDDSGLHLRGGYIKVANEANTEFMRMVQSSNKPYITLFIDNTRLYKRDIRFTSIEQGNPAIKRYKEDKIRKYANEDLLALCASIPHKDFVIFTGFDDTPIDEDIQLPENVLYVYATNCPIIVNTKYWMNRIFPMPYGLQRKFNAADNRIQLIQRYIDTGVIPEVPPMVNMRANRGYKINRKKTAQIPYSPPNNLLYINHSVYNNPIRLSINAHFKPYRWATIKSPMPIHYYPNYLKDILAHKYVLCPDGNAIGCDCHRDWETIIMGRIPVIERTPYKEQLFSGYKVLFVDSYKDITEELLLSSYQDITPNYAALNTQLFYNSILQQLNIQYNVMAQ